MELYEVGHLAFACSMHNFKAFLPSHLQGPPSTAALPFMLPIGSAGSVPGGGNQSRRRRRAGQSAIGAAASSSGSIDGAASTTQALPAASRNAASASEHISSRPVRTRDRGGLYSEEPPPAGGATDVSATSSRTPTAPGGGMLHRPGPMARDAGPAWTPPPPPPPLSSPPLSHASSMSSIAMDGSAVGGATSASIDPYYVAPNRDLLLSKYMVSDREYEQFLLYGRGSGDPAPGFDCGGGRITGRMAARTCAGWSFVGMMFLLWAGCMIELQPLYIKGINYNEGFVDRSDGSNGGGGDADDFYGEDGRVGTYYSKNGRKKIPLPHLRRESKTALKAAAAYFLTMVFSIICVVNYEQMGELAATLYRLIVQLNVRRRMEVTYYKYRRRHYTEIPDASNGRRRGRRGGGDGANSLPMFQSASSDTTRRRKRRSGEASGGTSAAKGNDGGYRGGGETGSGAKSSPMELLSKVTNSVKSGMKSPMGRRKRDSKTKHI